MTLKTAAVPDGFKLIERCEECFVLLRNDGKTWIVEYPGDEYAPTVWCVYRPAEKVKNPDAPWSSDNRRIDGDWRGIVGPPGFTKLDAAVKAARGWQEVSK